MEEKVKDFFENIKDRVSNPLIFSFVLTWLVYNWKITISLIWYDKSQITAEGCKSIFEFIDDEWNRNGSLKEPIIIAFLYTILLPIFKNLNRLLNSIIYKYGDILDFKILKGSSVSVEKYLKFRDLYLKRTEELKEVIKVEEEFIVENNNLKDELERSKENEQNYINHRIDLNEIINSIDDITYLNGYWKCEFRLKDGKIIKHDVQIRFGRYEIISNNNRIEHEFDIKNFYLNKRKNTLFFTKRMTDRKINALRENDLIQDDIVKINQLRIENIDLITGFENENIYVKYERVSPLIFETDQDVSI